jgi:hypothetical protein
MKALIFYSFMLCSTFVFGQKNYTICYDKLNQTTTYYKEIWENGRLVRTSVKSIELEHNDVVTIELNNVNKAALIPAFTHETIKEEGLKSPLPVILSGFSGFGGPALSMLTQLASNAPTQVSNSRGTSSELEELKVNISLHMIDMHKALTELYTVYNSYEEKKKIKFDKSLTKDEIITKLKVVLENEKNEDVDETFEKLKKAQLQLQDLKLSNVLTSEDPIWLDIQRIESQYYKFLEKYTDEDQLKNYSLDKDLIEVENTEFIERHTFLALAFDRYGDGIKSNEFIIVCADKTNPDNTGKPNIDFIKIISIPVKKTIAPKWSLGVDAVFPFGGNSSYSFTEIEGDYWNDIPDSIRISASSTRNALLTLGTKLSFDIPTERSVLPSIFMGAALSSTNIEIDEWNLSFLLGSGLRLRKFSYISLNAGLSITQLKVLKSEYQLNTTFEKPDEVYSDDDEYLYQRKFKPGLFVGIGIQF